MTTETNRRGFLKSAATLSGGLLLSFYLPSFGRDKKGMINGAPADFSPNAFLRISENNEITVICNHSEMGQGTFTAMSQLIADELDGDWTKIKVEPAPVSPVFNHTIMHVQLTGNSMTALSEWQRMREMGASARYLLIAGAAREWGVDASTCSTDMGYVIHKTSSRRLSYGELIGKVEGIKPPEKITLKDEKDFKYIGKPVKRLDTPLKINGTAVFGMDVSIPGMLTAVVLRPPVFGGKVKSFDAKKALASPGVKQVVQINRGIAVVADGYWNAKKGRELLEVVWEEGALSTLDSSLQRKQYEQTVSKPGLVARKEGDTSKVKGFKKLQASYSFPYLSHSTMEPMNCLADVKADSCDLYLGTQAQTFDQLTAAGICGLKPEQIKIHTQFLGGGFGRRSILDGHVVSEAVELSKTIGQPVKVIWSREDDIKGGYYRTASYHLLSADLDEKNQLASWNHRLINNSFVFGSLFEKMMVKDGVDPIAVEGASDIMYDIPNIQVEWHRDPMPVPTLWMRSVGHSYNAFVVETFIDSLAEAAKKDPYLFRTEILKKEPRLKGVLDQVVKESGWGKTLKPGHALGIAAHGSYGSYVAQVAEVSINALGRPVIHKVTVAVDCGPVINPDTVRAQMEGSIIFGLTSALYGEISFKSGKVQQSNFYDYRMLRMNEAPQVDVHIVQSNEKMGGIGEPGVPPVAPAVANALYKLTGKRITNLPFTNEDFKKKSKA